DLADAEGSQRDPLDSAEVGGADVADDPDEITGLEGPLGDEKDARQEVPDEVLRAEPERQAEHGGAREHGRDVDVHGVEHQDERREDDGVPEEPLDDGRDPAGRLRGAPGRRVAKEGMRNAERRPGRARDDREPDQRLDAAREDRKSTRLNSSHVKISYAVFCLKKKKSSWLRHI